MPRALALVHGERATPFDLLLVYGTGILFGVLTVVLAGTRVASLPWEKSLLLFLVAACASGGVVTCFTPGMDRYYAGRPGLRWAFIFSHVVGPALLFLLFDGRPAYWAFLYLYTMAAASLVNVIRERQRQQVTAAALVSLGMVILLPLSLDAPFLAWFAPVYMTKMVLAFAVRRT